MSLMRFFSPNRAKKTRYLHLPSPFFKGRGRGRGFCWVDTWITRFFAANQGRKTAKTTLSPPCPAAAGQPGEEGQKLSHLEPHGT